MALEEFLAEFAVLPARLCCGIGLSVTHFQAALDLPGEILAVELAVLGVELAMDVCDFPLEGSGDVRHRQLDIHSFAEQRGRRVDLLAHERTCGVEPGDRHRQVFDRIDSGRLEPRREDPEHLDARPDVECHRSRGVEARRQWKAAVGRDEIERRFEADDPAAGCGDPNRATGIRTERRLGKPGCEGRRGPAARAARYSSPRDRIRNGSEVRILRRDSVRELVQIRLADVHVTARLESAHRLRRAARDVVGEHRRSVRRRQACCIEEILDGEAYSLTSIIRTSEEDPVGRRHIRDILNGLTGTAAAPAGHRRLVAAVRRSDVTSDAGSFQRTSLLPARSPASPSCTEPSVARSFPLPLEKTMKRSKRSRALTRSSSGA